MRQRRDRQQRIGGEADEQNAAITSEVAMGRRMKGAEMPLADPLVHSCCTLVCAGSELATAVLTRVPG